MRGTLLRRYQRFLADVRLEDGALVTAHCPNPGRMTSCAETGKLVLLSDRGAGGARKLRYTWEAIRMGRTWVSVNTMHANKVVAEAIAGARIPELSGYAELRREVAYGKGSRVDLLLQDGRRRSPCYVEIKCATLRVGDAALFPDAVTLRGTRHLWELAAVVRRGQRAVLFFLVGRGDCRYVGPADDVDPMYGRTLRHVAARGVELCAYRAAVSPRGIDIGPRLPVRL